MTNPLAIWSHSHDWRYRCYGIDCPRNALRVEARCIAAGGVDGSEGAVTIAIEELDEEVQRAIRDIRPLTKDGQVSL